MSNLTNKRYCKNSILDKSVQLNSVKRSELFAEKNTGFESSYLTDLSNTSGLTEMLPRKSNTNSQMNQLFKVPNVGSLPVKKASVKSIKSPRSRVQTGRVKNELKASQQSKMSLIPRPSFINSRKSLHGSRSTQLNARKELIKKMVFLAECALKENKEIKQVTPVKMLAGLTPRKTPRSGSYFIIPEFQKKIQKLEEIKSPIEDFIKKEMFSYSNKQTPLTKKQNDVVSVKQSTENPNKLSIKPKEEMRTPTEKLPEEDSRFVNILHHCKTYSTEVNVIHDRLKALDDSFESKLKAIPDYRIYNEFCSYQSRKEEIYREMHAVEEELKSFIASQTNIGQKLKAYLQKKREFMEKQMTLHRDFERAINIALEKCEGVQTEEKKVEKVKKEEQPPRLRRSLRLSKIKKSKFDEKTPMTRKLKKLDNKSKGILKSGKV